MAWFLPLMIALYIYFSRASSGRSRGGSGDADSGFFFATVSGSLCGMIGSSNNPVSGSDAVDVDHCGAADGVARRVGARRRGGSAGRGGGGVRIVGGGGRTAAGFQGRLYPGRHAAQHSDGGIDRGGGGERWHVLAAVCSCRAANIKGGGNGFGDPKLSAPQAGLMAVLAQGIVGGDMPWPLVVVGVMFGI